MDKKVSPIKEVHSFIYLHDLYKKFISVVMFLLIKVIEPRSKFIGAKKLKKIYKSSPNMFALASGSSIESYGQEDFELISESDSIGVNYFIFNSFKPTFYLIETHDNKEGYFDFFKNKEDIETPILYKGYSSHKKIGLVIQNARKVSKNLKKFLVLKDGYHRGQWSGLPMWQKSKILELSKSDFLYNSTASILFVVFMSYKMGYKNIILCGFDMSSSYFYCDPDHEEYQYACDHGLCTSSHINTIHSVDDRKNFIIEMLVYIDKKLQIERGGGIFMYKKEGELSKHLRLYLVE